MLKNIFKVTTFAFLLLPCMLQAKQTVSVDLMKGFDDIDGIRLAYRPLEHNFSSQWFGDIKLYWELSAYHWEYGEHNNHSTSYALSITPIFMKQISTVYNYPLYVEAGIGASFINDEKVAGKDIGSNYQFEDRVGLLLELDNSQQVALRYMHFSNGGFNSDNPGLDFINLSYAYRF